MAEGRLADVIPLRIQQDPPSDTAGAAPTRFSAARHASGMTPARFAAELTTVLGWTVRPEWVLSWESGRHSPDVKVFMAAEALARHLTASIAEPCRQGSVAGSVLRSARQSARLSTEDLAGRLGVDPDTVDGWETGRDALGDTKAATLRSLTRRLQLGGVAPQHLGRLDTALDVDLIVGQILADDGRSDPLHHPLATWVSTREWNNLLGEALAGDTPTIGRPQREALFANLRLAAERATVATESPAAVLLQRQAAYMLAAWDPGSGEWLAGMQRRLRRTGRHDGWTPAWVAERSMAVSAAVSGDRDVLHEFIATRMRGSDVLEAANLAYWSYWCGEAVVAATSDEFMAGTERWRGDRLLQHLTDGLDPATPYLELSVHAVWALLERRPQLLHDDPDTTADLAARTSRLLDTAPMCLGQLAVKEINEVQYATRMVRGTR